MIDYLQISLASQQLSVIERGRSLQNYFVSTAQLGAGEAFGSFKTPRGWHVIRAKIGAGLPENTVFEERRPTGEIFSEKLAAAFPHRDWILTRILWLSGTEIGKNRLGHVDTMRRFIYIHGTPEQTVLGTPGSRGCIRMHNKDLIQLFEQVVAGTRVLITEE